MQAGARLLAALDDAGLQAQGAGWVFDHALGDWRYVVATSLVDTMGRSKVYRQLLVTMKKLDMPNDLTVADIHLVSPKTLLFKGIASFVRVEIPDPSGFATFTNCMIGNSKFDAVIYRWVGEPTPTQAKQVERQFKRRIKELSG